jgi:hypothetical protein
MNPNYEFMASCVVYCRIERSPRVEQANPKEENSQEAPDFLNRFEPR